uniref:Uncharacterized protein n=1 Tax=Anguilla anguilla TaxID=7936 RepID=A0A0E9W2G6_ANGAN
MIVYTVGNCLSSYKASTTLDDLPKEHSMLERLTRPS